MVKREDFPIIVWASAIFLVGAIGGLWVGASLW